MTLDNDIKRLLTQNIQFFTQLIKTLEGYEKVSHQECKFLIDVCHVALRENRKILDNLNELQFEPANQEAEDYVTQLHLNEESEREPTEEEKKDIEELEKIYNTPDPNIKSWLQKLLGK